MTMSDKKSRTVVNNLRVVLASKGRSQGWLARAMGVDSAVVTRLAAGRHEPRVSTALKVASLLNCIVEDIWSLKEGE